jgi:hypothetical protein
MARYLNPNLFMTDGGGDIPSLVNALNTFITVGNQVAATKTAQNAMPTDAEFDAANNTYVNSAGENVPPPNTTTDTATVAATVAATVTPTYTASDLSEIQRKISLGIPINDAEQEILSAYQATGNTASTGSDTGGSDTGGNDNTDVGPDGVDGISIIGGLVTQNGDPYTGEWNGKNYKNGVVVVDTPGGDKYETVGDVFTKNGEPYTGTYQGKEYKDGKLVDRKSVV